MKHVTRWVYRGLGLLFVGLGIAGIVLPLMPATVFFLIASYFFAHSSPRLDRWLREHRFIGPTIRAWHEHRAMPRRAKIVAIAMVWIASCVSVLTLPAGAAWNVVRGCMLVVCIGLTLFLTRFVRTVPSS
ncbi:MAG: YbaN family protein [Acidobacteria bacterium]|nr:YbaN family protein [Acidobacteriota bacterium]